MTRHILIADDEPDIRELMTMFIGACDDDIETHIAENGEIAFEMYRQLAEGGARPDVVIMDLRMPVMGGIEATEKIIGDCPDAKVYVVTAYSDPGLIEEAMNAGAEDVVNKTIGFGEIAEMVRCALES